MHTNWIQRIKNAVYHASKYRSFSHQLKKSGGGEGGGGGEDGEGGEQGEESI